MSLPASHDTDRAPLAIAGIGVFSRLECDGKSAPNAAANNAEF